MWSVLSLLIPIVFLYMYFALPQHLISISLTPLGRFLTILIIMYYTTIDIWYGMLVCLLVILYYQADFVEGMSNMINPFLLQPVSNHYVLPSTSLLAKPAQPSHSTPSSRPNEQWDIFDWISPSPEEAVSYAVNA
jgi:hypothetical protein